MKNNRLRAFKIKILNWPSMTETITAHVSPEKARYAAFCAAREVHKLNLMQVRVLRAPKYDSIADKLEDRFVSEEFINYDLLK